MSFLSRNDPIAGLLKLSISSTWCETDSLSIIFQLIQCTIESSYMNFLLAKRHLKFTSYVSTDFKECFPAFSSTYWFVFSFLIWSFTRITQFYFYPYFTEHYNFYYRSYWIRTHDCDQQTWKEKLFKNIAFSHRLSAHTQSKSNIPFTLCF